MKAIPTLELPGQHYATEAPRARAAEPVVGKHRADVPVDSFHARHRAEGAPR